MLRPEFHLCFCSSSSRPGYQRSLCCLSPAGISSQFLLCYSDRDTIGVSVASVPDGIPSEFALLPRRPEFYRCSCCFRPAGIPHIPHSSHFHIHNIIKFKNIILRTIRIVSKIIKNTSRSRSFIHTTISPSPQPSAGSFKGCSHFAEQRTRTMASKSSFFQLSHLRAKSLEKKSWFPT